MEKTSIRIGKKQIGPAIPPFIIAEMSGNHNQSLDRALKIVDEAAKCGVSAVKLQTYTADTITLDISEGEFFIKDKTSLWSGKTLHQLYKEAFTPWEWHEPIMKRCKKLGLVCFSSPFDFSSVDFLEKLNVPAYKIASPEIVDIPLIKKVASTGKPLIISTGMASKKEIGEAVQAARKAGCKELILLKCTTSYPADPKEANLMSIRDMQKSFAAVVGLSDHTLGIGVAISAIALGASVIEKHFTLKRTDGGPDSAFSMEPEEMKLLVNESRKAWSAIGKVSYGPSGNEKKSLIGRRSLYIVKDMEKGDIFSQDNIKSIRPALGLPPKYYEDIIGRKISKNAKRGTRLSWNLVR